MQDAPHHLVSLLIKLHSWNFIDVPIFTSLAQSVSKSEDRSSARALHVHNAPQHLKSCMYHRIHSLNCVGVPNFASITQSFPKTELPMYVHSARAVHVHYAPYQEMASTIEIHSLNSISVPNLESIAQNFLEPEDPSGIKFSGVGARRLHPTGTETTKAHTSGHYACNLQVSHQRCQPFGL